MKTDINKLKLGRREECGPLRRNVVPSSADEYSNGLVVFADTFVKTM